MRTPRRLLALLLSLLVLPGTLGAQQALEIAVERKLAGELGLEVGDTVRLGTMPDSPGFLARIVAVYQPMPDPTRLMRGERHVRLHLADLAGLLGQPDRVDRFGVRLRPGVSADSASRVLNAAAFGYRALPSAAVAAEASQTFMVVSRFHRAIGVISIIASAVFLLCIMLLKVEERRLDAAVLRFVGIRRRTIFRALLLEACLIALAGSVLGTVLAYGAGAITNFWYRRLFDTTLTFAAVTPGIVAFGVLLSLGLGVAAGALAASRLTRTSPMALWGRG